MLQVFNSQSVPSEVKCQVANWQDGKRAMTGYACFEFATPGDDVLVFSENGKVTAVALLCPNQADTDYYHTDILYLAYFATAKSGIGKFALECVLEYAHRCGFEIDLIALNDAIGFYEKCNFLYQVGKNEFASSKPN